MKKLSWLLTVPLMALAAIFAIANRESVTLDLWPLAIIIQLPLFLLVLGSALVGLLAGGLAAWFSGGQTRRRLRAAQRQNAELEREVDRLQRAHEEERAAPAAQTGVVPLGPPATEPAPTHAAPGNRQRVANSS